MLIIVGHGPSVDRVPGDFIDEHKIVRLRHCPPTVGTRTDVIASSQGRHKQPKRRKREFWNLLEYRGECVLCLRPFNPKFSKPSSGLSAVMIASMKGYKEIGVIGFDWTLHPELLDDHNRWRHDLWAENKCLLSYNVIDIEKEFYE